MSCLFILKPIKAPPIGKKYVRCQCHCLLICKAGSKRVACPRENWSVVDFKITIFTFTVPFTLSFFLLS